MSGLSVISLFSGAGGMDLGVEDAGGDVRVMLEPDSDCIATLEKNSRLFPNAVIIPKPLEKVSAGYILERAGLRRGEVAMLVGGPPCQPFSKSGYWRKERRRGLADSRASLPDEFLRVLRTVRPESFIFENVAGLTHPAHRESFDRFIEKAHSSGYAVASRLLHAVEYGVPQTRARLFAIGLKGRVSPSFPPVTHWWGPHHEANELVRLKSPETAGNWLAPLADDDLFEAEEVLRGRWAELLTQIPPGWNYKFHTAWARHRSPTFVTETKYWTFLLKLSPFRPSWTIQATPGPWTGPFHWENRRLRVPELAVLQTFPTTYEFRGTRRSKMRQIGNAVPCVLASRVARTILAVVSGTAPRAGRRLRFRHDERFPFAAETTVHRGARW